MPRLAGDCAGSTHLRDVGLEGATDATIWAYAARQGFVLVTKDEDLHRLSVFRSGRLSAAMDRLSIVSHIGHHG